jgi:type VI protein secretion system component VasF
VRETTANVKRYIVVPSRLMEVKMNHQEARYIPQRRLSDKTHRRWQDRFPFWRLALAAVVMAVVGFVFFQLICRYA